MESPPNVSPDFTPPGPTFAAEWLLDTLPWAVLVLDEQGRIRRLNQQAARWCDAAPEALLGRLLADAGLAPALRTALLSLLESEEAAPHEVFLPGPEQWLTFSATRQPGGWVLYGQDSTPRKQREQHDQAKALRRRGELTQRTTDQYQALFHAMNLGFCVLEILFDEAGHPVGYRMLEMNPRFEELTRQQPATFPDGGRPVREMAPELEAEWYAFYGNVALTGAPAHRELYAEAWNRWFEVSAYPTGQPERRQVGVLYSDITARKQAEQQQAEFNARLEQQVAERTLELQESRDLLRAIAEAQSATVTAFKAIRSENGRIVDLEFIFANTVTEQLDAARPLVGRRYREVFPEADNSGTLDSYRRVIETGVREDRELAYTDGRLTGWLRSIATRLGDGVLVVSEDITDRKQAEQERTRNLRLLEQAEAVAGLGSWDYDLRSHEFRWSEGMYRLFGLPPGQPVRPDIYRQFVVAEDRPRAEQLVQRLTTGSGQVEETLRLRVGEQVKTVRLKAVVHHDEAGQPVRVLGVDLDISQLQRLEADNLRLRLTRQQALFEAVQAAQEAERRRMAESLHNSIGQMLYATKLRLDRLHVPLLGTDSAVVAARQEADQLLGEAIRQTRALSHELVPLVLEEFGLAAALQDIGHKMSTSLLSLHSHVGLDEAAAPLGPALQMALYRMAQELAQNIIKHARGATQASLELETTPGWVLLRAEDNGPGFAAPPADGPGLGLRSIRDRVALLGGQLEAGTAVTGGAYVRIRIPLPASPTP